LDRARALTAIKFFTVMRQNTFRSFSATRGREINLFSVYLSTNAIDHVLLKWYLRMIVNNFENDLQN